MAKTPKKMSDVTLQATVEDMLTDAVSFDDGDRKIRREMALAYMHGEMPDLPAEENRSSVVSQDIADAKAWLLPSIMRTFCASDRIALYEPETPGDEDFAERATDYINHVFMRECDGENLLRDVFDDALGLGNGIVKHWWDDTKEHRTYTLTGLDEQAFVELVSDPDVEVLEHSERQDLDALQSSVSPAALGVAAPGGQPQRPGPPAQPGVDLDDIMGGGAPQAPAGPGMPVAPAAPGANPAPPMGGPAGPGAPPSPLAAGPAGAQPVPAPGTPQLAGDAAFGALLAPPSTHDVKIRRVVRHGRLRVVAVADEDFLIESQATALNERECRFVAHRDTPTRSKLIEQGYNPDLVAELGSVNGVDTQERRNLFSPGAGSQATAYGDTSADRIEVFECYALLDVDGDGIAEWHQVVMAGRSGERKLLRQTEWGGQLPFSDVTPDPVPHVWRGRSLYDRLRDVQRVSTVLWRKMLDNTYQVVEPGRAVNINMVDNPDALIDRQLGELIRCKGDPNTIIKDDVIPSIAPQALPLIEEMRRVAERRTGVGEQSSGLNSDTLSGQVATAVAATQSASGNRQEDYARNIQIGLRRLFSCLLKLICEHQDSECQIRLGEKWVAIDPRSWNADMHVSINVGLGSGNRDRDLAMLQGVAQKQETLLMQLGPIIGLNNPILGIKQYLMTLRKMSEAAGIKSAEQFFPDPSAEVLAQIDQKMAEKSQQGDPKAAALQAKAQMDEQIAQTKLQGDMQTQQTKMQMEAQQSAAALQHKQALAEAELQAKMRQREMDAAHQMELDRAKHQAEITAQQLRAQMDAQIAQAKMRADLQVQQVKAEAEMHLKERELQLEMILKERQAAAGIQRANDTNLEMPE